MAVIRPLRHRLRDHAQAPLQEADHGELPGTEGPDVPEVPRQAGADARRERPREVRRLRAVLGRVPGRRDLPRGGRERRHRAGRPALRVGLPDSQDALHLLRLLRGGVPGRRDLHGQGLRARGLQQGRLRLGQDRTCSCRRRRRRRARGRTGQDRGWTAGQPSSPYPPVPTLPRCRSARSATSTARSTPFSAS